MKNASVLVPLLALSALATAQRPGGDPMKTAAKVAGEYVTAARAGNFEWFRQATAPGFTDTHKGGKRLDRKGTLAEVAQEIKTMRVQSMTYAVRSARWTKDVLTFVADYRMSLMMKGQQAAKPMSQNVRMETKAVWREGRWVWLSVREM